MEKKSFGNLILFIMQILELHFSIVLAPTWPTYHVSAIKELMERLCIAFT